MRAATVSSGGGYAQRAGGNSAELLQTELRQTQITVLISAY